MNGSQGIEQATLPKLLVTHSEAAEILRVGKSTLYAMVSRGEIPVVQFGNGRKTGRGCTRYRLSDLTSFIDQHSRKMKPR